jgi:type II secretory pathway component GspD/PulD (secretin)
MFRKPGKKCSKPECARIFPGNTAPTSICIYTGTFKPAEETDMLKKSLFILMLVCSSLVYAEESVLEIITLNYRPAEEVPPLLAPLLEPSERIVADGANLIIRATPERLEEIRALVAQLDAKLHNLLITVLQGGNISAEELNAGARVQLNVPLDKPADASGRIQGQFHAAQSSAAADNTQTLRTLEGQAAYIKAGQSRPVRSVTVYDTGHGYPAAVSSTAMLEVTTGFAVTPRLSGDEVLIAVSPWSDRLQNNGAIATQSAATNLRAKLGEWIEIGGIRETSQYQQDGALSRIRENRNSALRILIKVEIID